MKHLVYILVLVSSIFFLASCSDEPKTTPGQEEIIKIEENPEITYASTLGLNNDETKVINSNTDFAWNLFAQLNHSNSEKNVVLSPLSVSIAMTMLANATTTNSNVRTEIINTLGYSGFELSDVNSATMKLANNIDRLDKDVVMALANSLWVDSKAFQINPDFVSLLKKDFNIESYAINRQTYITDVNQWCNVRTNGMINKLLNQDATVPDMSLINATYFKGMWSENNKFDKSLTQKGSFRNCDSSTSQVDFMNADKICDSRKTNDMEMITLPFGNKKYNFCIIRPNDNISIDDCLRLISSNWTDIKFSKSSKEYLSIKLPKFDIEYSNDLKPILSDLGMGKAMNTPDYFYAFPMGLQVQKLVHKARLRIDEDGAEGAAITGIDIATDPGDETVGETKQPRPFYLDHPFIYLITEKESGAIIFMGCVKSL